MKEVLAVIRMNMMNETKQALSDAGISSFTARKVMGRGQGKVDYRLLRGAEEGHEEAINQLGPGPKLIPKRLVSVVVPDDTVQRVVRTIIEINRTNHPGDGKVFVLPVTESVRLRTGERNDAALSESPL
jgi:nitrogen regulatory protein PII 2